MEVLCMSGFSLTIGYLMSQCLLRDYGQLTRYLYNDDYEDWIPTQIEEE